MRQPIILLFLLTALVATAAAAPAAAVEPRIPRSFRVKVWYCRKNKKCAMMQQDPWVERLAGTAAPVETMETNKTMGYSTIIEYIVPREMWGGGGGGFGKRQGPKPKIDKGTNQHLNLNWCYTFGTWNDHIVQYGVENGCCEFFEHARCIHFLFSATNRMDAGLTKEQPSQPHAQPSHLATGLPISSPALPGAHIRARRNILPRLFHHVLQMQQICAQHSPLLATRHPSAHPDQTVNMFPHLKCANKLESGTQLQVFAT
ncbi:hypothetical protein FPV67DRAFT_1461868 [Lyophyllum atratum]|nr:hypothetical protein FPV67DRAFT_1461868 [Lyophyllum atratum]